LAASGGFLDIRMGGDSGGTYTIQNNKIGLLLTQAGAISGDYEIGTGGGGSDGAPSPSTWTPPAQNVPFRIDWVVDTTDGTWEVFLDESGTAFSSGTYSQFANLAGTPTLSGHRGHEDDVSVLYKWYFGDDADGAPGGGGQAITPTGATVTVTAGTLTIATVPDAVIDLDCTPGNTEVVLTWSAPADGGSAITDYIVQYRPVGA